MCIYERVINLQTIITTMNKMLYLIFACILIQTHAQDCSSMDIEAIFPCTINFQPDATTNQCMLDSCRTNSPGNPVNQTNSTVCFVACCPGFKVPGVLSKNSMMGCYQKFNDSPPLVYIIGILIVVFLLAICAILPCCSHKECPLFKLRTRLYDCLTNRKTKYRLKRGSEQKSKDLYQAKTSLQLSKISLPNKSYLEEDPVSLDIDLIIGQKEDPNSSCDNICLLCSKTRANCKLFCGHFYHLECIAASWQNLECCPLCEQKRVFPLSYYCNKCFKVAVPRNNLSKSIASFVCGTCYAK